MIDKYSGVLVIGHGTQDPAGMSVYFQICNWISELLPGMVVAEAFLEFARPTIGEATADLAARGIMNVAAVPLLLSGAGHTAKDVPRAMAEAAKNNTGLKISLKPHIGVHPRVAELSALRFQQALQGRREIPLEKTLLAMVAHGSPEPDAIEELRAFAAARRKLTPVGGVECCFAVLGQPQLEHLPELVNLCAYQRVVVQAHLLLRGCYCDRIDRQVQIFREKYPDVDWIVTEPLGADRLLAQATVETVMDEAGTENR
ncbi:MAG: sirohydrochlorin chelatase [Thermoguttaceae bacterium]